MPPISKALCFAAALASSVAAHAGWKGGNITWTYYAFGNPYDTGGSPGQCRVHKKQTGCGRFFSNFEITTDPDSITFTYLTGSRWTRSKLSLPPTVHNGLAIDLNSGGEITAVTIDPETNMAGFDNSRISFTAKQIQIDWQKLHFTPDTKVKLNIVVTRRSPAAPDAKLTTNPPRL